MTCLKLVTVATAPSPIRLQDTERLPARNRSTVNVSEEPYHFEECWWCEGRVLAQIHCDF